MIWYAQYDYVALFLKSVYYLALISPKRVHWVPEHSLHVLPVVIRSSLITAIISFSIIGELFGVTYQLGLSVIVFIARYSRIIQECFDIGRLYFITSQRRSYKLKDKLSVRSWFGLFMMRTAYATWHNLVVVHRAFKYGFCSTSWNSWERWLPYQNWNQYLMKLDAHLCTSKNKLCCSSCRRTYR
jgi:hypothetical protein